MKEKPQRFRIPLTDDDNHPNGSDCRYRYGCYFPLTDLCVTDMGHRGTGKPTNEKVEWLDLEES